MHGILFFHSWRCRYEQVEKEEQPAGRVCACQTKRSMRIQLQADRQLNKLWLACWPMWVCLKTVSPKRLICLDSLVKPPPNTNLRQRRPTCAVSSMTGPPAVRGKERRVTIAASATPDNAEQSAAASRRPEHLKSRWDGHGPLNKVDLSSSSPMDGSWLDQQIVRG